MRTAFQNLTFCLKQTFQSAAKDIRHYYGLGVEQVHSAPMLKEKAKAVVGCGLEIAATVAVNTPFRVANGLLYTFSSAVADPEKNPRFWAAMEKVEVVLSAINTNVMKGYQTARHAVGLTPHVKPPSPPGI